MPLLQPHLPAGVGAVSASMVIVMMLMLATVLVLMLGLGSMLAGGNLSKRYGNKLMVARVACQALTIAAVGVMFLLR